MASLFKLELEEWDEFKNRLNRAGLTAEQVRAVNMPNDIILAGAMVGAVRKRLEPMSRTVIEFEVDGRKYEAVGFLDPDEPSVDGYGMVARTDGENGGGLGKEDGKRIGGDFPSELRPYDLVFTKWRDPDDNVASAVFFRSKGSSWQQGTVWLGAKFTDTTLVVRRLA